jgi:DNA repair protein RadC
MNTSSISLVAQLRDGSSRPATADEIIAAARDHMSRRVRRGTQLSSPKATRDYLSVKPGSLEREVFAVSASKLNAELMVRPAKAPLPPIRSAAH